MKILIVTRSAWDDSNSIGNTMTNLFSGYDSKDIANLYFREAKPKNKVCKNYFRISDKMIIKSIFNPKFVAGKHFNYSYHGDEDKYEYNLENRVYDHFRKRTSSFALIGQSLLWEIGSWKNNKLDSFLEDFQPDIIFSPSFHTEYTHNILGYIQKKTNAKVALFHADDYLTVSDTKHFFSKIKEKRRAEVVKNSIKNADINYCISQKQKTEYGNKTGVKMDILYKGADFTGNKSFYRLGNKENSIRIVYIGSILYGRWKTLTILAEAIKVFNSQNEEKIKLEIYSQYKLSEEMQDKMIIEGASVFKGKVSPDKIKDVYSNSDIVLHVESFDDIEKLKTRLSFSTKIVDCLNSGRTIMAIGWKEAASIDYLLRNDAAIVANDAASVLQLLNKIKLKPYILEDYAYKAWNCGKENHDIKKIQKNLFNDFQSLVYKSEANFVK